MPESTKFQITNEELQKECNVSFSPSPVSFERIEVTVTPGPLIDELCETFCMHHYVVPGASTEVEPSQLVKYLTYLVQERIKQVNGLRYDRNICIPCAFYALVGSIYRFIDKKTGREFVPVQGFDEISSTDEDVQTVYRKLRMNRELLYSTTFPPETESQKPGAIWASVIEDRVVALDEVTLIDALFTSLVTKYCNDLQGEYRVDYGAVRGLVPAVHCLATR